MTPSTENEWVQRLQDGHDDRDGAISELRVLLVKSVSASIRGHYGGDVIVEDIVQESLIRILKSLDSFAGRSRFTTWALTIANRVMISELRKNYYRQVSLNALSEEGSMIFDVADERIRNDSERSRVMEVLSTVIESTLTERQRIAVRGSLEGLPAEEIASRLGSNRNSIYKLVHDARLKMRAGLESLGITIEDLNTIFS